MRNKVLFENMELDWNKVRELVINRAACRVLHNSDFGGLSLNNFVYNFEGVIESL